MALASFLRESRGERNRPPEPPRIYARDIPSDAKLTFVDFVPSVTNRDKRDRILYHSFRILLDVANKWLQHNDDWEVVNCESVTLLFRHNACSHVSQWDLMPNVAATQVMGQEAAIKALRVWIRRREDFQHKKEKEDFQVLGYRDYVPEKKDSDKIETLDEVINRLNLIIREGKFEGRILSVECLPCESTGDLRFDPEATLPGSSDKTVTIVRIYYEEGPSSEEEIGMADFVPVHLSGGSLFSRPEFESFDNVISRASRWLSENPEINFRNAQSIDFKLRSMTTLDTRIMTQTDAAGDFVRVLRISYTKPMELSEDVDRSACLPPLPPIYLYSQLFLLKSRNYADLKKAISDWYNSEIDRKDSNNADTGSGCSGSGSGSGDINDSIAVAEPSTSKSKCQLLSCETLSVFAKNRTGFEESFNSNRVGARNRCTFIAVRLYYDSGFYLHKAKQNYNASVVAPNSTPTKSALNSSQEKRDKSSESCAIA